MTAPAYAYAVLAIESDNLTVAKTIKLFVDEFDICYKKLHKFYFNMYSFRNFVYQDQDKEFAMNELIRDMTVYILPSVSKPLYLKYQEDWSNNGNDISTIIDTQLPLATQMKPLNFRIGGESPVALTKSTLMTMLGQSAIETCFNTVKAIFFASVESKFEIDIKYHISV